LPSKPPSPSRWIAKTLGEFGHEVIVANPKQVQLISANHSKNDSNDSAALQSSGKQNQTAKTFGRNEAVVYVRLLRLEALEIVRNERARQGYSSGVRTPRCLYRRRASCASS